MTAESTELYPPLPDDIPAGVWNKWPRKGEAHLLYGVRKRVVTNRIVSGVLRCWACPDSSVRIPTEQLEAALGEKKPDAAPDAAAAPPIAKSDRTRVERARLKELMSDAELELDDPIVGMFRECRLMLKEERSHTRETLKEEREHFRELLDKANETNEKQLKLLVDPIGHATKLMQETSKRLADRVTYLEERQDSVIAEREMMADFRQVRDVELEQVRGREKRRSEVLALLKREIGPVLLSKLGGDSLAGFVANVRPELIDLLIASKLLTPEQEQRLTRIVETLRAKAEPAAAAPEPPAATPEPTTPPAPAAEQTNGAAAQSQEKQS